MKETKKREKMIEVLRVEEYKQAREKELDDFKTFYNIVSNKPLCDADKKVRIDIRHTRETLNNICCNKEVAQKILDLIKADVEKEVKEAEEDLRRLENELKEML